MSSTKRRIILLLSIISIIALSACTDSGKPATVIISPPSGSVFREGEDVTVQSTSTDAKGVVRVELIVDNVVVRTDSAPIPQGQPSLSLVQTWKATQGTHTLVVRAYNATGAMSDPVAISISASPAIALGPTSTPTTQAPPPVAATPTSTTTPTSSTSSAAACTDNVAFGADVDVTVPDGTNWSAGQTFNKIWRIRNSGTCAWNSYNLVFVGGEAMTANTTVVVPNTAPGATADVLVPMTAPATAGEHTGSWRLRNAKNAFFGLPVTVKINVIGGASTSSAAASSSAPTGCVGTPNIASFTASAPSVPAGTAITVVAGTTVTLNWGAVNGADSAEIDQGIGGVETPGSRTSRRHQRQHTP